MELGLEKELEGDVVQLQHILEKAWGRSEVQVAGQGERQSPPSASSCRRLWTAWNAWKQKYVGAGLHLA